MKRGTAIRTLTAFLIAPVIAPLLMLPWLWFFIFPGSPRWLLIGSVIATVFSYFGTTIFGSFGLSYFVPRGVTSLHAASLYGAISGMLVGALFLLLFCVMLDGLAIGLENFFQSLLRIATLYSALVCGCIGALVGNTFWWIARPDRLVS